MTESALSTTSDNLLYQSVSSAVARALNAGSRLLAGFAALCALALAAVLLSEFQSIQLSSLATLERFVPGADLAERLEADDPGAVAAVIPAARLAREAWEARDAAADTPVVLETGKRSWFLVSIRLTGELASEPLIVSFSEGLVVPDRIWRVGADESVSAAGLMATADLSALPIGTAAVGRWVSIDRARAGEIQLVARIVSPGVGQPKVQVFRASDLERANQSQVVRTVAFTSILLILACFGAVVAVSSRDWTFLVFSAWLLMSLRLVAVNSGWGLEWATSQVSIPVVGAISKITLDLYGLFTIALYRSLLKSQIGPRAGRFFMTMQTGFLILGASTFLIPDSLFYRLFWGGSAVAILAMVAHAAWLTASQRSLVAFLFLMSWVLTFGGMGAEILYSAGILARSSGLLNAETGALGGALACALALAHRLRAEIIARQVASRREIRASRALKKSYESMPIGLFGCDRFGRLQIFNPAFAATFQSVTASEARIGSSSLIELVGAGQTLRLLERGIQGKEEPTLVEIQRPAEPPVWLQFRVRASEHGAESSVEGSISDVSSRVVAERKLEHLVDHDPLTGALNQRGLTNAITAALDEARHGIPSLLADLHIDRFKMVNDLHGLAIGDAVLQAVHERLVRELAPSVPIARIGDTFKIVLQCPDDGDEAGFGLANRVLKAIADRPFEVEGRRLSLTTSIGLVPIAGDLSVRDVLMTASHASADAKAQGRNRVVHVRSAGQGFEGYLEELSLQATLRDRLESDRFFLEFQPIVNLRAPFESLSLEALVRLRDEQGGVICPSRFVPAAERNGQISMIDRWVLESTLVWLSDQPELVDALSYATVNLSGASLNDARFVDDIFGLISNYPRLARKLCFEITETVALADRRATRRFADRVHSMGGFIALDDFGAGYTSFAYLKEIDADVIKIDGSFVRDIHENPQNMAITRTITDLAHQFGKRCVAEWVETPETVAALMLLSVDYAQGFALGRPMKPEGFIGMGSCGAMVKDPAILALLKGEVPARQVASVQALSLKR